MKNFFKSNKLWMVISALFLVSIAFTGVFASASTKINEEKVSYNDLVAMISELETNISELEEEEAEEQDKLAEKQSEVKAMQSEVEEATAMIGEKEKIQGEIDSLQGDFDEKQTELEENLDEKETELDEITVNIEKKQSELEQLETGIAKKKEDPIELISGTFIVGSDVPPGRYQATNVGQGSNFVVYSSSGSLKVNTILGDDWGSGDHVFFAEEGDQIETAAPVQLIPVEE
ncbi:seryl-tRNA synthetase [Virgibacillus natechei]|uniref:Seryl-tRNA synthetase n=1 Tax=Virgibacillus natechei TaxID=1216297 RepID=A0ABS4IKR7_9BACI|nr:hypothetical protein [Virgibacillus natechei]MBP1971135.1 seryl-tRNA synthetase [Virgibacillus natechei]UZD12179.1 hypothetical protein OLD84_14760 [Virgibacillus natechei]